MQNRYREGVVIRKYSGFYYVQDQAGSTCECKLRGKIKCQVLTGDRVGYTALDHGKGVLEEVLPRRNELYRPRIANVDLVMIVMACDKPAPSLMLLDRLLVLARHNHFSPLIVLNKCDLPDSAEADFISEYYPAAGYDLVKTSAQTQNGLDRLRGAVKDRIAVFAGPSGVGKSSLLNAIQEGLDLRTQEVSKKLGRGRHTTRHVELYPIPSGGWIADTPGFSVLDLPVINKHLLWEYFIEFSHYTNECRFSNCLHYKEKECGVRRAVQEEAIAPSRYKNYVAILEEIMKNERCYS